jgi:flagellar assembly protein FliH
MSLEKPIIKALLATETTFEYKPRELGIETTQSAKEFVSKNGPRQSPDFKISTLVAQQAGISQLERSKHQDNVNAEVLSALKEIEERAYKEGHDLGLVEGSESAFQESKSMLTEKMASFEALLKRMEVLKQNLMIESEAALVRLTYLIAKKIAMRDIAENKDAVMEILKTVVSEMQSNEKIVVRLSHEDLYFIEPLQDKVGTRVDKLDRVKLQADEKVKNGGCFIETEFGNVDATVEERVERMWQTLEEKVPRVIPENKP